MNERQVVMVRVGKAHRYVLEAALFAAERANRTGVYWRWFDGCLFYRDLLVVEARTEDIARFERFAKAAGAPVLAREDLPA